MEQRNRPTKKGFSLLSFFLGLLFGIIILAGALGGVIYYALTADIDSVFKMVGMDNSKDESGRNKYVNTDEASNLMELFSKISALTSMGGSLTLGDFDRLVPATTGIVQGVVDGFSSFVDLDIEELKAVPFSGFGDYLSDTVKEVELSRVVKIEGGNAMVDALINGVEADTVEIGGRIYPVYEDEYYFSDGVYMRKDGDGNFTGAALSSDLVPYLFQKKAAENKPYYLYYYKSDDGNVYVLSREDVEDDSTSQPSSEPSPEPQPQPARWEGSDTKISLAARKYTPASGVVYGGYDSNLESCTGNYYTNENGEKVTEVPVLVGDYMGANGYGPLDRVELLDLLGDGGDDEIMKEILGGVTVGEVTDGEVNFSDKVDEMNLNKFIDVYADDSVTVYIGYGITNLAFDEVQQKWIGRYTPEGADASVECFAEVEEIDGRNKVTRAYYIDDGKEVDIATKIGGINDVIDGIGVDIFLKVNIDEPMMLYLGYGLTEVEGDNENGWTGKIKITEGDPESPTTTQKDCTIEVNEEGIVVLVYYEDGGERVYVPSTSLDGINDRVTNITKDLKLKEVMDIDPEDKVMVKLGEYKIEEVGDAIDTLELSDVIDNIESDSAIMAYIAFGVTDVGKPQEKNGEWYATATYKDRSEGPSVDKQVYLKLVPLGGEPTKYRIDYMYTEEGKLAGTTINQVSDRVDGVMDDLKLGELITVSDDNTILNALKDTVISGLNEKIASLTINELYYTDIYQPNAKSTPEQQQNDVVKLLKAVENDPAGDGEIKFSDKYLYYRKIGENKYELVEDSGNGVGKVSAYEADLYTYGETTPLWKLLLFTGTADKTSLTDKSEKAFKINDIGDMIQNVTGNINNATLRELTNAGILTLDPGTLGKSFQSDDNTFGGLKLSEAIEKLANP